MLKPPAQSGIIDRKRFANSFGKSLSVYNKVVAAAQLLLSKTLLGNQVQQHRISGYSQIVSRLPLYAVYTVLECIAMDEQLFRAPLNISILLKIQANRLGKFHLLLLGPAAKNQFA